MNIGLKTVLFIAMMLAGNSIFAQGERIMGKVSSSNGTPLEFVNISVRGTNLGAISNQSGNYTIQDIKAGTYTITASFIGFNTVSKEITIIPGQVSEINFVLSENLLGLQTVEITGRREIGYDNKETFSATKTASLIKDVPASINFVTKELMLDQVAFTVNDVVKNVAGVNQYSFYNDISIRGFRVQGQGNSGTLLNGMRTFTSFWKPQLIPHIERVEVIKGPASALFGNASPGGSINRVTKKNHWKNPENRFLLQ